MPAGISPATIKSTVEAAADKATTQAKQIYPELKAGVDQLDGKLAGFKTYQKGKSALQKVLSHPYIEQTLRLLSEWFQKLSIQMAKWAESASNRARAITKAHQLGNGN
jgi:regulator of sigma D